MVSPNLGGHAYDQIDGPSKIESGKLFGPQD
jgi:hypothetical protein